MKPYQENVLQAVKTLSVKELRDRLKELAKQGPDYQNDINYLRICAREPGFHAALVRALCDGFSNRTFGTVQDFMEKVIYLSKRVDLDAVKEVAIQDIVIKYSVHCDSEIKEELKQAGFHVSFESKGLSHVVAMGENVSDRFDEDGFEEIDLNSEPDLDDEIDLNSSVKSSNGIWDYIKRVLRSIKEIFVKVINKVLAFFEPKFLSKNIDTENLKNGNSANSQATSVDDLAVTPVDRLPDKGMDLDILFPSNNNDDDHEQKAGVVN